MGIPWALAVLQGPSEARQKHRTAAEEFFTAGEGGLRHGQATRGIPQGTRSETGKASTNQNWWFNLGIEFWVHSKC